MTEIEKTILNAKPLADKEQLPFAIAQYWPRPGASIKIKQTAVKELIANHTLIVGQSRSGKTNAARRLIEEILLWTDARVIILDPNADFRLLKELDTDLDMSDPENVEFSSEWSKVAQQLGVATPTGTAWGIKWSALSLQEMAAYLNVSPTEAFEEYRHLDRHLKYEKQMERRRKSQGQDTSLGTISEFMTSGYFDLAVGEDLERYRLRLQELSELDVWWKGGTTKDLDSLFDGDYRAVVVDLSQYSEQVRMITASRTLQALWGRGECRRKKFLQSNTERWNGTVVVIDEAHLFAGPKPEDPQKQLLGERIQRFADQGKKLNLYLVLVTQQPGKLHPEVLAELNNRIILRVNERRSLIALEETYGGLRGRYNGALTFQKGEALIEGALLCDESPEPAMPRGIQFNKARTKEGGGTPNTDWAIPRTRKQKAPT
jgi:hypothetical protein